MARTNSHDELVIDLAGHAMGEVSARLVALAEQSGYTVAVSAPGTYRLARTRRKLFGKSTDSVVAKIFESRTGPNVRFVGAVDPALVAHLQAAPERMSNVVPAVHAPALAPPMNVLPAEQQWQQPGPPPAQPVSPPQPFVPQQRSPAPPEPPAQMYPAPIQPTSQRPAWSLPVTEQDSHRPTPPSAFVPSPTGAASEEPEFATIVQASARSSASQREAPLGRSWLLDVGDGRRIPLISAIVVGRNPSPESGPPGAQVATINDLSLSKSHVLIEAVGAQVRITDLHSTNGTVVSSNGSQYQCQPMQPVAFATHTIVQAGDVAIEVIPVG